MIVKAHHHFLKLLVVKLTVFIFVKLFYEVSPLLLSDLLLAANGATNHRLEHVNRNLAFVFDVVTEVKEIKGVAKIEVGDHNANLVGLFYELTVSNVAISVLVHLGDDLPQVVL